METINSALANALKPAQLRMKEDDKLRYVPSQARCKLQFLYRNGTSSIPYFSYDSQRAAGGIVVIDESVGYSKLIKLMSNELETDSYLCATIFVNLTDDLRPLIDGKLNRSYNHIAVKHVRNRKPFTAEWLDFKNGLLNKQRAMEFIVKNGLDKPFHKAMSSKLPPNKNA